MKQNTVTITGTALLLAIALLSQSMRLIIPISPLVSLFLVGTLVSATLYIGTVRYGAKSGLLISWATPLVAFMQGFLPIILFIPIVAIGNSIYVCAIANIHGVRPKLGVTVAVLGKAGFLFLTFYALFHLLPFPIVLQNTILYAMSWPQIITGLAGWYVGRYLMGRLNV